MSETAMRWATWRLKTLGTMQSAMARAVARFMLLVSLAGNGGSIPSFVLQ